MVFARSVTRVSILAFLSGPWLFGAYSFTRLYTAPAAQQTLSNSSNVAINNQGLAAFQGTVRGQFFSSQVLMIGGESVTPAQLPLPERISTFNITSINSSGTVAFVADVSGVIGVYTSSTSGLVQIAVSAGSPVTVPLEYRYANPTINDRGDVTFLSSAFGSPSKIMVRSGGQTRTVAELGTQVPLLGKANSNGTFAYAIQTGQRPAEYSLFVQSGSGARTLVDKGSGDYLSVTINDEGAVTFKRDRSLLGSFVATNSTSGLRTVIDSTSVDVIEHISTNNSGAVLMRVSQNAPPYFNGLTAGSNFTNDKVIATGDALFGSTVRQLSASYSEGQPINDRGQIVFRYELASGEAGVAIANPAGLGLTNVNSASFSATQPVAQDSIVSAQGEKLATTTATPTEGPSLSLGGSTVTVTDSTGTSRPAPLFFVSPRQINYLMPSGIPVGPANVRVVSGDGTVTTGSITVSSVAPGIYALNAARLTAANVLRVRAGAQTYEPVYSINGIAVVPLPIDLGPASDQVYLLIYGTGIRRASNVSVMIGGASVPVLFFGATAEFPGLDQINIGPLPRTLVGFGAVDVLVRVDAGFANDTSLSIR